jgi:thiamine biosynthesis lipoprotein
MDYKKYFSLFFLFVWASCQKPSATQVQKLNGVALGTRYSIRYQHPSLAPEVLNKSVDSIFNVINQSLSTYLPNSDISKINQGDSLLVIDSHFEKVYHKATEVWKKTAGYFDPTVGALVNAYGFGPGKPLKIVSDSQRDSIMQFTGWNKTRLTSRKTIQKKHPQVYFDFNALAKGYAVDVLADFLRSKKIRSLLVEIGGEIVAQGKSPKSHDYWKIAIDDPKQGATRSFIQVIELRNQALATSGNYRKFSVDETTGKRLVHSINPLNGKAIPTKVLSTSVLASDCMTADAYATALMVIPLDQGQKLIQADSNLEAYWIIETEKGVVEERFSSGFPIE